MKLKYEKIVSSVYSEQEDEIFEETEEIEYEVKDGELLDALSEIVNDTYFKGKADIKGIKDFLKDNDYLLEDFAEYYYEDLKDYFRSKI